MQARQCYHVTVPLSDSKEAHVYFKQSEVYKALPPTKNNLIHEVLHAISHQLTSDAEPKTYYVAGLQKDTTKGDGGGYRITLLSESGETQERYFSNNTLLGLGVELSRSEIPVEAIPAPFKSVESVRRFESKETAYEQERLSGIAILTERRAKEAAKQAEEVRKQEELKAQQIAAEKKQVDAENARMKAEKDLTAAKKMVSQGEQSDPVSAAITIYQAQAAEFSKQLQQQDEKRISLKRAIHDTTDCDAEVLLRRIKQGQAQHHEKLLELKKATVEKLGAYQAKVRQIQQEADAKLLTDYQQFDKAVANLHRTALATALDQYAPKNLKQYLHELGEIALAAGLKRLTLSNNKTMTHKMAKELYTQWILDNLAEKNHEEMARVIENILARFKGPKHPFVAALHAAVRAASHDKQGRAYIAGFSAKAVQQEIEASAERINEMQKAIAANLTARSEAIEQYEQFLEKAKAELVAVENRRKALDALESQAGKMQPTLTGILAETTQLQQHVLTELKSEKQSYTATQQKYRTQAKDVLNKATLTIHAITENNTVTVTRVKKQLEDKMIDAAVAEKSLQDAQAILDGSINAAEIQQQLVRCAEQAIQTCDAEEVLVQKDRELKALQEQAKALATEIRAIEEKPGMGELTDLTKEMAVFDEGSRVIREWNTVNFERIDHLYQQAQTSDMKSGTLQDLVDENPGLLAKSITTADEQVTAANKALEAIQFKHAQVCYDAAQKALYEQIKSMLLEDKIPYWNKQRLKGGGQVLSNENKIVTVPTGIAQMIHLIRGKPEKQASTSLTTGGLFGQRGSLIYTNSSDVLPSNNPQQIREILMTFREISKRRLSKKNNFFSGVMRRDNTSDLYKKLAALSLPDVEQLPPAEKAKALLDKTKELEKMTHELSQSKPAQYAAANSALQAKKR